MVLTVFMFTGNCFALWEGYDDTDSSDVDIIKRSGEEITYHEYLYGDDVDATVISIADGGYTVYVKDKADGREHTFEMDDRFEP